MYSLKTNYWVLVVLTIFSFICGIILCYLDTYAKIAPEPKSESTADDSSSSFGLAAICKLPAAIWLLVIAQITVLQGFQLQDIVASRMFQLVFGMDNETAGAVIASPALVMGAMSFVGGIIIYHIGRKPLLSTLFDPSFA